MGILNRFKKEKDVAPAKAPKAVKSSDSKKAGKVEKAGKAGEVSKKAPAKKATTNAANVPEGLEKLILKPFITEKSAILAHDDQYVFVVDVNANRVEIRNAVKALYGVRPLRVNIQNYAGKRVRYGRSKGKQKNWKKAIVTLPKGSKIDVYEGV